MRGVSGIMSEFLIEAKDVSVVRRGNRILDTISMTIEPGEFITVVGPNGAGKTVLLHALMGLTRPTGGRVTRRAGLKIGYMPQRFTPEHTMPVTVRRFLMLADGVTKTQVDETLALVQAAAFATRPLHVLSGGELQRVLLARALLHRPDLLVLDEPAQNLDIGGGLAFYRLLEDIYKARGCAILMVSHDLHMVMASSSRVICLFHHICCSGTPDAVAQQPEFAALFGQDFGRMMSLYQHHHAHEHGEDGGPCHDH
jgi:zinc transport system ATP-binding protein